MEEELLNKRQKLQQRGAELRTCLKIHHCFTRPGELSKIAK